jgi:D-inositol-3-phosphate glycosyltransferase
MKPSPKIHEDGVDRPRPAEPPELKVPGPAPDIGVTLLTGGIDRPYVFGLAMELLSKGVALDIIGSDTLEFPEFHGNTRLNFLNLQGSQRADVSLLRKVFRLFMYYLKLIRYSATAKSRIFHILWNNKFEMFDRTLLTLYFRSVGKKIILTVHNVNRNKRDSRDTYLNRLTLRIQYRMADHIFVHTESAKLELGADFGVEGDRITVIPFGINNAVPTTNLSQREAKQRLGIADDKKAILFFGRITQYKGLEHLIAAFRNVLARCEDYRLMIAGRPENDFQSSWRAIQQGIEEEVRKGRILLRTDHVPDSEIEVYFKAADVLVLPYRRIYQSGVLFLGYSFGLAILAADLGGLKEEIIEGKTGFVFKSEDPLDLARAIEEYFSSDLFKGLADRRQEIQAFANERHSWDVVGQMTTRVYADSLRESVPQKTPNRENSKASRSMKAPRETAPADPD